MIIEERGNATNMEDPKWTEKKTEFLFRGVVIDDELERK
jgi:hypothetical protein